MSETPDSGPAIFAPGRPIFYVFAVLSGFAGVAFGSVAGHVALFGTGATVPAGDDVVEGVLLPDQLTNSPAGEPFLAGEVTLGRPNASSAIDHRWRGPAGDLSVRVQRDEETLQLELPPVTEWRGRPTTDERVVENLDGLPIVSTVDQVEAQLSPPYAIAVRAVRPGDSIIARVEPGATPLRVTELLIGERSALQADLEARESMRFPIVGLMALMALASLLVSLRAFRRARNE